MASSYKILILEDEPLIMMDLEYSAEDRGCEVLSAASCGQALEFLAASNDIDVAILDVSLGEGQTCFPVAEALKRKGIPFLLHSGDLNRHDEKIRELDALLVAKPTAGEKVIAAAIVCAEGEDPRAIRTAAE